MQTILAAVDFSPITGAIAAETIRLAKALGNSICFLHVAAPEPDFVGYEPGPQHVRDTVAQRIQSHHEQLHALRDTALAKGVETEALLIQGPTAEKIVEEARRLNAGTIVVGSHGYGAIRQLILGSVSEAVIKDAPCPVLVVPRSMDKQDGE
jgi:nucleotide-binding universal stress UspA family protein